jgi:hypothetical protein
MRGLLVFLIMLLLLLLLLLTMQPVLQQRLHCQHASFWLLQTCCLASCQPSRCSPICSCSLLRQLVLQQQVAAAAWADKGGLCVTQLLLVAAGCCRLCGGAAAAAWPVAVHVAGLV